MIDNIATGKHKLSQVVHNLISNALKFSLSPGEVVVHLGYVEASDGAGDSPGYFLMDVVGRGGGGAASARYYL